MIANKLFMALGAPGGGRIITGVLQVILNVLDFKMNIQEAIDFPRVHHQWKPDEIYVENGASPDTVAALRAMGHKVVFPGYADGLVEGIVIDEGWLQGGAEIRSVQSKAKGY